MSTHHILNPTDLYDLTTRWLERKATIAEIDKALALARLAAKVLMERAACPQPGDRVNTPCGLGEVRTLSCNVHCDKGGLRSFVAAHCTVVARGAEDGETT